VSALRKAGVWLGLIEDEDDRGYDDHHYADRGRDRDYRDAGYPDEYVDDEEEVTAPHRSRGERDLSYYPSATAEADRIAVREPTRLERAAGVRSITRPAGAGRYASREQAPVEETSYPTRDNLALAPQVQLRERAVVAEDADQRYQITTLHPTTHREARAIGEHFRDGVPVIINLTEMDEADARRVVDFAAGLAFGLRGTIERVTNRVFLLSPANVQVTAEDKAKIAEGGFFDQS
jgi:cell division inhibitor SepF